MRPEPSDLRRILRSFLQAGETLLAAAECDMLPDGKFGKAFLLATDRRLAACRDGLAPLAELPLGEIRALVTRNFQGCHAVEALTEERSVLLAMFSSAREPRVARALDAILPRLPQAGTGGRPSAPSSGKPSRFRMREPGGRTCSRCGDLISGFGVCPRCLDRGKVLLRLLRRMRRYTALALGGLLLTALSAGLDIVPPWLTRLFIDKALPDRDLRLFFWILGAMISLRLFRAALNGTSRYYMTRWSQKVVHDLRQDVYRHLQTLSIDFYDAHSVGWINDRVLADTRGLQWFLTNYLQQYAVNALMLVFMAAAMISMNWKLALLALSVTPLNLLITVARIRWSRPLIRSTFARRTEMHSLLSSVIPGIRVVKAFAREAHENMRLFNASQGFLRANLDLARLASVLNPLGGLVTGAGTMLIWGLGGYALIAGDGWLGPGMTLGTFVAFLAYLNRFHGSLGSIAGSTSEFQQTAITAQRIFEVLDTRPSVRDSESAVSLVRAAGKVEFNDVWFEYQPGRPVLKGVTFSAEPGERIGIVGASGSGKSTLMNLLCRFYDPQRGDIRVDGVDVREVRIESLRQQMGMVLQEPFLFPGTIAENIVYGRPAAGLADVIAAAKAAGAHYFILRLPDGYDTLVQERGVGLSGGERQRVSIARAVLNGPAILILDEATANLDSDTERKLQLALENVIRGRTTFLIAHRLSTLRSVDRILVMDGGGIVENGRPQDLLDKEGGIFRAMARTQSLFHPPAQERGGSAG